MWNGFADLMNQKAQELGLKNSHFSTPHGLDKDDHYTTATDLAHLTAYALQNPKFCELVRTKTTTIYINSTAKSVNNTNELLGNLQGVYGVKTGFTGKAGRCLVTSVKRGDLDIISVVLGADTKSIRTQDSIEVIEYTYKNFEMFDIKDRIDSEFEQWLDDEKYIQVIKGESEDPEFTLGDIQFDEVPINKKEESDVEIKISYTKVLTAPVTENQIIGDVEVTVDDNILGKADILVKNGIDKKNMIDYMKEFFSLYKTIL